MVNYNYSVSLGYPQKRFDYFYTFTTFIQGSDKNMNIFILSPRKSLNKAYLKVKPSRSEIELFKVNLIGLLDGLDESESEEHNKNDLGDFLKNTFFYPKYYINTKDRTDLVIHNGADSKSFPGVLIEAKKPSNKTEMIRPDNLNTKAFQELILYYLRERITNHNLEIKHLVATNVFEWYVFDANLFEKSFAQNKKLVQQFTDFEEGRLARKTTDFFYKEIAEPFVASVETEFFFTWFDFREYDKPLRNEDKKDDSKLIALYKVLSPEHLLKLPFTNDSNSLDKSFYSELLHIIGLTETKEGSKKLIGRKKEGERNSGSLIESAIMQLESLDKISRLEKPAQFGDTVQERLFNVALELSITWINRILFLKLLEAQMIKYHKGDKSFAFLNCEKVRNFDDLNSLFFSVLARRPEERNDAVRNNYLNVPYLNSSLFEPTGIEHSCLFISQLKDDKLPIIASTVLKDNNGKKYNGELYTLEYLFKFLDAYDFAGEGAEEIQEENKTLINASVLGLIFEKINGYKDGSFFTPGFITMYICRETIRRAIVQKFNDRKGWNCSDLTGLYDKIEDKKEANEIVNELKICDPAVGSGHFLVSALNEIIAIKSELKILSDKEGKRLKEYHVEVVNDELIITDEYGDLFEYNPGSSESQRVQETLFHEKQTIIENCLFGVDINPNSVKICRLRLWIELLKNAYYMRGSKLTSGQFDNLTSGELQTLPNIDINIKCGNSLISRYALDADIRQALKKSKWSIDSYRLAVMTYRNARGKDEKREMERLIEKIKNDFQSEISQNDPKIKKRDKLVNELYHRFTGQFLFEPEQDYGGKEQERKRKKEQQKIENEIAKLNKEIDEIKENTIFENAFEWRFEFPEVLNDEGDFAGFDVVIGNPPYISLSKIKEQTAWFENAGYETFTKVSDIYCIFYEKGVQLLANNGILTFITSNSWMRTQYGEALRKFFVKKTNPILLINIEDSQVFEEATVESNILIVQKGSWKKRMLACSLKADFSLSASLEYYFQNHVVLVDDLQESGWIIGNEVRRQLKAKIEMGSKTIKDLNYPIYYGIKTGFNEAFFITDEQKQLLVKSDPQCSMLIKSVIRGKDIFKYGYKWKGIWAIIVKTGWTNANKNHEDAEAFFSQSYPSIYKHLRSVGETEKGKGKGLFDRDDKGDYWWELRPCSYYDEFEKEKIIWGELSDDQKFTLDNDGHHSNNTIFFITGKNLRYLLAILNSKLAKWYFNEISTSSGMGTNRWLKYKIEQLPIKDIAEDKQVPFVQFVNQILSAKNDDSNSNTCDLENEIDQLVFELYGLTEEEIKIVEGEK